MIGGDSRYTHVGRNATHALAVQAAMLGVVNELRHGHGPVVLCKRCNRRHARRANCSGVVVRQVEKAGQQPMAVYRVTGDSKAKGKGR